MPVFQKNFQKFTQSEYSDRVYNILQKNIELFGHTFTHETHAQLYTLFEIEPV